MHTRSLALAAALVALTAAPALAATAPTADFDPGQQLGIGLAGVSWDYGFSRASLGVRVGNPNAWGGSGSDARIKGAGRAAWRFIDDGDLKVASLVGLELDPGPIGGRAYMVPDLGLGVAYHLVWNGVGLNARFNVSLTVDQGQNQAGGVYPLDGPAPLAMAPTGNLFQRLILGPNTMIGVGFDATDRYELTLGGGTLLGLRVRY